MPTKFFKAMTQPIADLTLYALMAASWSSRAVAQLPTLQPEQLQQTPLDNRLRQLQQARRSNPSSQLQSAYIQGRGDRLFSSVFQALLQTGDRTQDLTGRDGDTIFIPLVTTLNPQQTHQLATASFAADPHRARTVAVVGEVKRPGSYSLIGTAADLRDNDIVVVSRSNTARVADALNLFISPDAGIIRLFSILGIR